MSQENVEGVREIFAAMARRDNEAIFGHYQPDIEWHDHAWLQGDVKGFEGIRRLWRSALEPWEQSASEPHDFVDGGDRVVVTVHVAGRGRASGVNVERQVSMVWTFRDRKISRVDVFFDRAEALEAAGLAE